MNATFKIRFCIKTRLAAQLVSHQLVLTEKQRLICNQSMYRGMKEAFPPVPGRQYLQVCQIPLISFRSACLL